jgi:1,3-beta-galactosyl-N-acetylhexosamine phosphorylase
MSIQSKNKGRVTLPAESGQEEVVKKLINKWGVDALRDSDGTTLSDDILEMDLPIYSTVCIVRAEQSWPREHPDHLPQLFLMSPRKTFTEKPLEFDLIKDWAEEKYKINDDDDPYLWWDVIDRTTGEFLEPGQWEYKDGIVNIIDGQLYHEYSVNFLVYQIWDSTSMYNAMTNNWTGDKVMCVDPFVPEVYEHLMTYFGQWLAKHPQTDVVRFTTLAFGFMLIRDAKLRCVIRDWCGYCEAVSTTALLEFEKVKGYRLRGEDFIQAGQYADSNLPPTQKMLDWMDFIEDFTIKFGNDLVKKAHEAGKKTAMFWGDHWIGAEPFSERFKEIGIDILVGAAEDGNALRRVSNVPHKLVKELRFYPYFFPDVFKEGANPAEESMINWAKIRRALLRKPVDRIGWGGYLSLASKFPDFINHITDITNEFREFHNKTAGISAYTAPIKVGVLNAWGKLRSWMVQTGPIEKFYTGREDVMDFVGTNINECLAGLPVDVSFFSFDDILDNPARLNDFDVIINEGMMGSAWSGGDFWKNPQIVSAIRKWVHNGGGFIGIGHPSGCSHQGKVFQLSDILGVELELGQSIQISAQNGKTPESHFITADICDSFEVINPHSYVFCKDEDTEIIDMREKHIHLACKTSENGRGVYMSSLPFSYENARLLHRAIFWAAGKQKEMNKWFSTNPNTDCAAWPEHNHYVVINNVGTKQKTTVFDGQGKTREITLEPYKSKWIPLNTLTN